MKLLSDLAQKMRAHRLLSAVAVCLVLALAVAGGYYGFRQYQYRQTSAYAFTQIKEALSPPNPARLATLVDFNSLTDDLAGAVATNFPFFQAGEDQRRNIKHLIQTSLLKRFLAKEEGKPAKEEDEEALLGRPLEILPPDFTSQLTTSLNLNPTDRDKALISAKIANPQLGQPFTLVFSMRRTRDGFKIDHLVNANETASHLRNAMLARYKARRESCERKNAATTRQMNGILPIQSCTANAGVLADGKTLVMVVHVLARNKSDIQVNNMTLDAEVDGRGMPIIRRFLNAARPVPPGADFSHRWNFELDAASDVGRAILGARSLSCSAAWQTLGLGNGKVLHIQEVPNPDRPCEIAGHNHPAGFCALPVFLH